MRWTVHGEEPLYDSEWVRLRMVDVEIPGPQGRRFGHHVVRFDQAATGVVVHDPAKGVLMLWRHRFISDRWGWEIPAGRVDPGETPMAAAEREVLEETGWRCGPLTQVLDYAPASGSVDLRFVVFLTNSATHVGEPTDLTEAERIEWVPLDHLRAELRAGRVDNGLSLTGVLWCLAEGLLVDGVQPVGH